MDRIPCDGHENKTAFIIAQQLLLLLLLLLLVVVVVVVVYIHFINIYFRQHNYIIKSWVKANATFFDLKCYPQAKLKTMKFFTVVLSLV